MLYTKSFAVSAVAKMGTQSSKTVLGKAIELSHKYYEKFPEDVGRMQGLARYLAHREVKTYTGGKLSPSRLRALGLSLAVHGTDS